MAHEFFEHLKEDHQELKSIGEQLMQAKSSREREKLMEELHATFEPHAVGEEASIYKYMTSEQGELREMGLKAIQEHDLARSLLKGMMKGSTENDMFKAKAAVLAESTEHHIQEEENKVFPMLEQKAGQQKLTELFEQYQEAEEEAEAKV